MSKGVTINLPLGSDAHFFEESIHPSTIKASLSSADPSSSSSTPVLVKGLKWLLAMMSKGRDLSDFFPAVVKLVGAQSLEARKMVYMYLVHYADHDDTCRELALLSINSFQRGLADSEQLIRALALRVMSSIRVADILQIQILAVQKCSKDPSPYVRKCAANAVSKLHSQCSDTEQTLLKDLLKDMLTEDGSTMVLTSAIIAFWELYPEEYQMLHGSYRKLCHLLTDMDEWGQVIALECLSYYCRKSFRKPQGGSGESIDKERRIKRTTNLNQNDQFFTDEGESAKSESSENLKDKKNSSNSKTFLGNGIPSKVKRRVVRKAFYSDEEDESSEEEVYTSAIDGKPLTLAAALRQQQNMATQNNLSQNPGHKTTDDDEDESLDPDHRLLLRSSLPLLKSRNSAVVLAVCSLHYYCGVSSIKIRTALGKALVRIHRDRREIQFVVLTSIRELVGECPSAFTPFLADFFVKAMDPSFTRMIKLEILTNLALEPKSINDILHEIRTYVRHDDKQFVCSSIKAIGRIAEISRIVFERVHSDPQIARIESDTIVLNCLHGLTILTRCSRNEKVIDECVIAMTFMLGQLVDSTTKDPNDVKGNAIRRLLFLVTRSLVFLSGHDNEIPEEEEGKDDDWYGALERNHICLSTGAMASALWLVGEWFTSSQLAHIFPLDEQKKDDMNNEILRLLARSFPEFESLIKLHAIHYSTKMLLAGDASISSVCSHILAQGRLDVDPDIRDRARFESSLLYLVVPSMLSDFDDNNAKRADISFTPKKAKALLLSQKPSSTFLPLNQIDENVKEEKFRFGTLSSLLHHRAGKAYLALPPWAQSDSDKSLRDPPALQETGDSPANDEKNFYGDEVEYSSDESSKNDSTSHSDDSYESTDEEESSEEETDDEESSDESSEDESSEEESVEDMKHSNGSVRNFKLPAAITKSIVDESSVESDSSDEESFESSSDEDNSTGHTSDILLPMMSSTKNNSLSASIPSPPQPSKKTPASNDLVGFMSVKNESLLPMSSNEPKSSKQNNVLSDDLSGLVMAPLVVDTKDEPAADMKIDSGKWFRLIRPELAGGLCLDARYVRGSTRKRELNVAGLEIDDNVLLLQLKFENKRTDFMSLRRIKLIQRTCPTLRRAILPLEISALNKNQSSSTFLILVFSSSHTASSLSARFEVKSDKGTTAIEIRPPLTEMMGSLKLAESEFDEIQSRMDAPHQKTTSAFDWTDSFDAEKVSKFSNLTLVKRGAKSKKTMKFVASLPHTNESICVVIEKTNTGLITIFCDNAIAANAVMEAVKEGVSVAD